VRVLIGTKVVATFGACRPRRSNPSCQPFRRPGCARLQGNRLARIAGAHRSRSLVEKRSSIKCWSIGRRSMGWVASVNCAGQVANVAVGTALPPKGALVHCAAESASASSPLPSVGPSFWPTRIKVVPRMTPTTHTPRSSRLHWGRRLTNRCSDPGTIKCSAAGGRAPRPHTSTGVPAC